MASERMGRPAIGAQSSGGPSGGNVVRGPWKGLPWKDPEHEQFFTKRDVENRLTVKLNAEATRRVWVEYREFKRQGAAKLLLMRMDGSFVEAIDSNRATELALLERCVVYNVSKRSCWRPVWWPSTPVDIRGLGNVTHEPVHILGWDSFIEGWENRPKAKLFENS